MEPARLTREQARRLVDDVCAYGGAPLATIDRWLSYGDTLAFYAEPDEDGRVQRRVQHFTAAYRPSQCHEGMRLVATYAGASLSAAPPSQDHPLGVETGAQHPEHAADQALKSAALAAEQALQSAALRAGADEEEAAFLARMGVDAAWITGPIREAIPFLAAAEFHGLGGEYIKDLLEGSGGDPEQAWELWAQKTEAYEG